MSLQIIAKNSAVSGKEPTAGQLANGELALNYHADGPFITCKDTAGVIRRLAGVWISATAPATPAPGEFWLDINLSPAVLKIYKDSTDTWIAGTTVVAATTTTAGIAELATNAETQTGSDTNRVVTPAGLQSKLSDSTSTTSSTTIASSTAVKAAYDLAALALPKAGGTVTGNLEIGTTGSFSFEGTTADGYETTLAVVDPTADRTITLPNVTGTVVTTGDTGTVTSLMLLDGTIVDGDINASAEIAVSKLADGAARQLLQTDTAGTGVEWTNNIDVPGTLDVTGAATFDAAVTIAGDLTVNGTTTTIDTQNLIVEDKNVIIGQVTTPSDVTADGGGITLKGATDKTINWVDATDAWTLSEHVNVASGKEYRINGTKVLDSTSLGSAVVGSSLTSVGTIGTGVWQGTAIAGTKISPDFGSQNTTTTGTNTAASFNPTSSTVPTNGVYLPAANSVAISSNGTGKVFVSSAGNVGIGTGSPSSTQGGVDISSGGLSLILGAENNTNSRTNAALKTSRIGSYHYTNSEEPVAIAVVDATSTSNSISFGGSTSLCNAATDISFYTAANNTTITGSERLRITSAGLVGIGTPAPTGSNTQLEVAGGTATEIKVSASSANNTNFRGIRFGLTGDSVNYSGIRFQPNSGELRQEAGFATWGGFQTFYTDGLERLRITSTGRVGIGATVPGAKLVVEGTGTLFNIYDTANAAELTIDSVATNVLRIRGGTGDSLAIHTEGSERARLDDSGRLLVGTPFTSTNLRALFQATSANSSGGGNLYLARGEATPADGASLGYVGFTDSNHVAAAGIEGVRDGGTWTSGTSQPSRLVFSTTADGTASPTERMKISNNGAFGFFSTTTAAFNLINSGSDAAAAGFRFVKSGSSTDFNSGTACMVIRQDGDLENTNNSYGGFSDAKLKENIVDAASQWSDLKSLTVRKYNFKEETGFDTHTQIGLVAQEVELVSPGLVSESPDRETIEIPVLDADGNPLLDEEGNPKVEYKEQDAGTVTKSVNYSVLYMKAVKALQEAMERIETLEQRLTDAGIA